MRRKSRDDQSFILEANIDTIHELYNNGLIYFKIPISSTDRFRVKILDGFVMNRLRKGFHRFPHIILTAKKILAHNLIDHNLDHKFSTMMVGEPTT